MKYFIGENLQILFLYFYGLREKYVEMCLDINYSLLNDNQVFFKVIWMWWIGGGSSMRWCILGMRLYVCFGNYSCFIKRFMFMYVNVF